MKFVHGWTADNSTQQQQDQQEQPKRFFNSAAMGGMAMDLSGHRLLVTTMDTEIVAFAYSRIRIGARQGYIAKESQYCRSSNEKQAVYGTTPNYS
ncbi:hypothetical protein IV203_002387 [Nitzschia inconspicua]|uniref:Uncharacterized protein n=1 Tax=Nitzschia inconspicua TaxID=303405 RepID=A0A9K3L9K5_9STRA|nr:hypothetical protein IV203_002387 [Nitzschia inconspicua]